MKKILIAMGIVGSLTLAPFITAQSKPPQSFNFVTVQVNCSPQFKLLKRLRVQITVPGSSNQPLIQKLNCGQKKIVGF